MAIAPGSFAALSKRISQMVAYSWLEQNSSDITSLTYQLTSNDSDTIKSALLSWGINLDEFFSPVSVKVECDNINETNTTKYEIVYCDNSIVVTIPVKKPNSAEEMQQTIFAWISDTSDTVYSTNQYIGRVSSC